MKTFGNTLSRLLRTRGWTHGDLARRSGYDRSTISRWTTGTRGIERENVEVLARVLMAKPHEEAELWVAAGHIPEDRQDFFLTMFQLPEHIQEHFHGLAEGYVR